MTDVPVWQVTAFVALLALDTRRVARRQLELAPCLRAPTSWFTPRQAAPAAAGENGAADSAAAPQQASTADVGVALDGDGAHEPARTNGSGADHAGVLVACPTLSCSCLIDIYCSGVKLWAALGTPRMHNPAVAM